MGLVVVSSEDEAAEELTEEDKEVQSLMNKGLETKRKAVKGMSNSSDWFNTLKYLHVYILQQYVERVELNGTVHVFLLQQWEW